MNCEPYTGQLADGFGSWLGCIGWGGEGGSWGGVGVLGVPHYQGETSASCCPPRCHLRPTSCTMRVEVCLRPHRVIWTHHITWSNTQAGSLSWKGVFKHLKGFLMHLLVTLQFLKNWQADIIIRPWSMRSIQRRQALSTRPLWHGLTPIPHICQSHSHGVSVKMFK